MTKPRFHPWAYRKGDHVDEKTGKLIKGQKLFGVVWTDVDGRIHKERNGLLTMTLARGEVERKRRAVQEASNKGLETVEGPKTAITLKQAAQDYIDGLKKQDTRDDFQASVDNFLLPILGNNVLASIRTADVVRFISERSKGAAPGTVRKDLAVLSGIFSCAQVRELVDHNPVTLARKAKRKELKLHKKIVRFLSPEEELQLYASLPPRQGHCSKDGTNVQGSILRDAVPFALLTGLREMELARLTWADYDASRRVIKILEQKNGNQDELPLCDAAVAILERLRTEALQEAKGLPAAIKKLNIFRDPETGKPLTRFNNTGWSRALVKAGIEDFRFHDLRHSFASRLAMAGASLQYVQRMMRHHSINQTLAYAHLCPEDNATGIDFQDRKGVALLDCYQDYLALLFSPAKSLELVPAGADQDAHAALHA